MIRGYLRSLFLLYKWGMQKTISYMSMYELDDCSLTLGMVSSLSQILEE